MSQGEDDDLVADDLIRQRERKAVEDSDASIDSVLPLGRGLRELENRGEERFELVFELGSETRLTRLVVVNLVVDLGESVASSTSASSSASADVRPILIESERLRGAGIDLGTSSFDLGVPRHTRVRVGLTIKAPEKLEG